MKNKNKNSYLTITKDPTGQTKDWVIEIGGEYDSFRIAVDFADLITIKNEIITIEERTKQHEKAVVDGARSKSNPAKRRVVTK